ncbi:AbrB/MazE/SpoVT family DNA-binding domain-containing protein [Agaribacter flavus]|uniref:AbrB/MazE/SpoVT family DNA-binding domain-containing protein n=1 Tax=Agaribacter flavus TaxID=1902781 RepID=A0ABV7FP35_9ALTE
MSQATVTSKGQITIPVTVRANMKLDAGDKVEFIDMGDGQYQMIAVTREVRTLKGLFKSDRVVSIDEMNDAIEASASA